MSFPSEPLSTQQLVKTSIRLSAQIWRYAALLICALVAIKASFFLYLAYFYLLESHWLMVACWYVIELLALLVFVALLRTVWRQWSGSELKLLPLWQDYLIALGLTILIAFLMVFVYEAGYWLGQLLAYLLHAGERGQAMRVGMLVMAGCVLLTLLVLLFFVLPAALLGRLPFWQTFAYSCRLAIKNLFRVVACFFILFLGTLLLRPTTYLIALHLVFWQAIVVDVLVCLLCYPLMLAYYLVVFRDSQLCLEPKQKASTPSA